MNSMVMKLLTVFQVDGHVTRLLLQFVLIPDELLHLPAEITVAVSERVIWMNGEVDALSVVAGVFHADSVVEAPLDDAIDRLLFGSVPQTPLVQMVFSKLF